MTFTHTYLLTHKKGTTVWCKGKRDPLSPPWYSKNILHYIENCNRHHTPTYYKMMYSNIKKKKKICLDMSLISLNQELHSVLQENTEKKKGNTEENGNNETGSLLISWPSTGVEDACNCQAQQAISKILNCQTYYQPNLKW